MNNFFALQKPKRLGVLLLFLFCIQSSYSQDCLEFIEMASDSISQERYSGAERLIRYAKSVCPESGSILDSLQRVAAEGIVSIQVENKTLERVGEALRLNTLAEQTKEENPTLALYLAKHAYGLFPNEVIDNTIHSLCVEKRHHRVLKHFKGGQIQCVSLSSDEQYYLTGSSNRSARLYEVSTGRELLQLQGHAGCVNATEFHPNGDWLLTGSCDQSIKLWSLEKGSEIRVFRGHQEYISSLKLHKSGKSFFSGSGDGTIIWWDIETGEILKRFEGNETPINDFSIHPSGKWMASCYADSTLKIWSLELESSEFSVSRKSNEGAYEKVSWIQGQDGLVAVGENGMIQSLNREKLDVRTSFPGETGDITSLYIADGGETFYTGNSYGFLSHWSMVEEKKLETFQTHNSKVLFISLLKETGNLISVSKDNQIKKWTPGAFNEISSHKVADGELYFAKFFPENDYYVTYTSDYALNLWRISDQTLIQSFFGHQSLVRTVAIDPSRGLLLSGAGERGDPEIAAILWDITSGQQIQRFIGHEDKICDVAFHPDSTIIMTGSGEFIYEDRSIRFWDISSGRQIDQWECRSDQINVVFQQGGTKLLVARLNREVELWDWEKRELIQVFSGHTDWVGPMLFHPTQERIFTGGLGIVSKDYSVRVWDIESGESLQVLEGHTQDIFDLDFDESQDCLISSSGDQTVIVWNMETGLIRQQLKGHTSSVITAAFSDGDPTILTAGADESIRLWDMDNSDPILTIETQEEDGPIKGQLYSLAIWPGKHMVFSSAINDTAKLWDTRTGELVKVFVGHQSQIRDLAIHPNNRFLLSGSWDKEAWLWDIETARPIRKFIQHQNAVNKVAFNVDGSMILTGEGDPNGNGSFSIRLWDSETAEVLQQFVGHGSDINEVTFMQDSTSILSVSGDVFQLDRGVRLWNINTGKEVETVYQDDWVVSSIAIAPDGKRAYLGIMTPKGRIGPSIVPFDLSEKQKLPILFPDGAGVYTVLLDPTGKMLFSGAMDNMVRVWDATSQRLIQTFQGHEADVSCLAYDHEENVLISGSKDRSIRFWRLPPKKKDVLDYSSLEEQLSLLPSGVRARFRPLISFP